MGDRRPAILKAVVPLIGAAEAAAAVGASLRLRGGDAAVGSELRARLDAMLDVLEIRAAVDELDSSDIEALLGIIEGLLAQAADFVARPGREGWDHDLPSILLAQGHSSALVAGVLHRGVVPALGEGLAQRLEQPGAVFLDVGAGVGALAIEVCRLWPSLRVVAVEPWEPALVLARELVAAAGLQQRIEIRAGVVEELDDVERFDLAWLPTFFIARPALAPAVERVHAALRPGGWATFGLYARPGDPFIDALSDLRTVRQGGTLIAPQDIADLLADAGFTDVGVHFDPSWQLPVVFVAGRTV